jgi:hypothetical protein
MKMVEEIIKDTELNRDVQKIFKVIESCKNENHVTHALKFIDLFVDKWGEIYGKKQFQEYYRHFLLQLLTYKRNSMDI